MSPRSVAPADYDPDLFWDQVRSDGDCWVWIGKQNGNGYGRVVGYSFTEDYAHRLSWTMARGPIPEGQWVLHHCDNPPCVNPDHLYVGTPKDNSQDRERRGRGNHPTGRSHPGVLHTHCVHGHPFTAENTIRFADGAKRCRTCARLRHRIYQARKRAA